MKLTSSVFSDGEFIPKKYTCQGQNISPDLSIYDPPENIESFAIMLVDPDAPTNNDFVHWIVWNIPPETREINEGTLPIGATEGKNDFGKFGYGGPCPPEGVHHYEFHLYALDSTFGLFPSNNKDDFRRAIKKHVIEEAVLVGLYEKNS